MYFSSLTLQVFLHFTFYICMYMCVSVRSASIAIKLFAVQHHVPPPHKDTPRVVPLPATGWSLLGSEPGKVRSCV